MSKELSPNEDIPNYLKFPKILDHQTWKNYLNRDLENHERYLLENFRAEKHMNIMMKDLYNQCIKKNLYVPSLTKMDGNCLFDSLVYHGLCDDVTKLRKMLSVIMYFYKNYPNFLPGNITTLEDLFTMMNDVEYVTCKREKSGEKEFYKYTYKVMCQDLSNEHCWSKLPTQLILMILSYIFKIKIVVINSSNNYEHIIDSYESTSFKSTRIIYLGHLGETHYVPLDLLDNDEELEPLYYNEAKIYLLNWAKAIERYKIGVYLNEKKMIQVFDNQHDISHKNKSLEAIDEKVNFQDFDLSKVNKDNTDNKDNKDNNDNNDNKDNNDQAKQFTVFF